METKRRELEGRLRQITAQADYLFQPGPQRVSLAMGRLVYNCVLSLGGLLALPFIGLALLIRPRYRLGLSQRLSRLPPCRHPAPGNPSGCLAARPVGRREPGHPAFSAWPESALSRRATVVLSVLTPTAYRAATSRLPEADAVIYFPTRPSAVCQACAAADTTQRLLFHRNRAVAQLSVDPDTGTASRPSWSAAGFLLGRRTATDCCGRCSGRCCAASACAVCKPRPMRSA